MIIPFFSLSLLSQIDLGPYDDWLYEPLFSLNEQTVTFALLFLIPFTLLSALFFAQFLSQSLDSVLKRLPSVNPATRYLLSRVCYYGTFGVGILFGLSLLGIDFTKLTIIAGALSVGIGFGLQNIVSNFVAGIVLLFDRSLKINDYVELESGVRGVVVEILMRYTRVATNNQIDILVPNSEFINSRVVNFTHKENLLRMKIPFGVAYGSDKELVKKAALEAAGTVPYTLPHTPKHQQAVWMTEFADSSLNFELVVWVNEDATRRQDRALGAYLWAIDDALRKYNIEIPFPQRDLHLRSHSTRLDSFTS